MENRNYRWWWVVEHKYLHRIVGPFTEEQAKRWIERLPPNEQEDWQATRLERPMEPEFR